MESNVDDVLKEAAAAVNAATPQRKERKPKEVKEAKVREPKVAKPKLYVQWNEDGSPMLDEKGERVKLETKMDRPKKPKAEGSGARTAIPDDAVLVVTGKEAKFREGSSRHTNYTAVKDGMTAGAYFEATGGRGVTGTFLSWYIKEGFVAIAAAE